MDVNTRNQLFAKGEIDRDDLWPKITEYQSQARTFKFQFGLDVLPKEPGIITIRGPRQYGKSTWLELSLQETLEKFGKGSAFFVNGDEIINDGELEKKILEIVPLFHTKAPVKRIFIDEISAIPLWEKALKRLADRGEIKDILIINTGSKATDMRRGSERLPGRKGKLKRTDYIFTGVSYKDFYSQFKSELNEKTWIAYLLSGGSPVAAKELWQVEKIPDYFYEMIHDWVIGEISKSGRSRQFLLALMRSLHSAGGSKTGFLKLAKNSGMANNTLAVEYIEQLSDILSVLPSLQWDSDKKVPLQKKPCKFHFVNLSVALTFFSNRLSSIYDFETLPESNKSNWLEWLVAQELFRRQCIRGEISPESIYFWASKNHEVDFVDSQERYYEVKNGAIDLSEFYWFHKTHPKKKLIVISANEKFSEQTPVFESSTIKGLSIEQFLLADGFTHPYPGSVEDPNVFNHFTEF